MKIKIDSINFENSKINVFLLVSIGFFYFIAHHFAIGIDGHDESLYLILGVTGKYINSWSPIYTTHYRILGQLTHNLTFLYDLNQYLVCCLYFPLSLYIFFTQCDLRKYYAFLISTVFLMSRANLASMPHVHVFNLSLILFLFSTLFLNKTRGYRFFFFFLMGILIFSRQENLILGLFLLLSFSFLELTQKSYRRFTFILISAFMLFVGYKTGEKIWGNPFESRGFNAFKDHFVWRNPDLASSHKEFDVKFPQMASNPSLTKFIQHYPLEFSTHVFQNFKDYPKNVFKTIFPKALSLNEDFIVLIFNSVFIFTLAIIFYLGPPITIDSTKISSILVFFTGLFLQGFISSLIFQPFERYLVGAGVIFLFLFLFLCNQFLPKFFLNPNKRFIYTSIFFFFLCLFNFAFSHETFTTRKGFEREQLSNLSAKNNFLENDRLLLTDRTLLYLPENFKKIQSTFLIFSFFDSPYLGQNFQKFLLDNKISVFCHSNDEFSYGALRTFGIDPSSLGLMNNAEAPHMFYVGHKFYICYRFNFNFNL
jgi:hypothetical protein